MTNFAKIKISATLIVKSGLHIGASSAFAAIGATDNPIIKDPLTNLPVIPGSSLKGKIRTLLARQHNEHVVKDYNSDHPKILRLFGKSASQQNENGINGRLIFRDLFLSNKEELINLGAKTLTEIKFENNINRVTTKATPRQIERIIAGSKFELDLIYNVENILECEDDIKLILEGLNLLEFDYLGGNGSRGYGEVIFDNLKAQIVYGSLDNEYVSKLKDIIPLNSK